MSSYLVAAKSPKLKVLHIITGLGDGGAEGVLCRLVEASSAEVEHVVISMTDKGIYGPRLRELGIPVNELRFPRGRVTLSGLWRLWKLIREVKPDAVQTWMYHADLVGGLMSRVGGVRSIIWGIRNSNLSTETSSPSARLAALLCARLSGWIPSAIVSCSVQAALEHQRLGYRPSKFAIIPNGYDLLRFSRQPQADSKLRQEYGIDPQTPLLGMVARWDPQKDHANLLAALALLKKAGKVFHCVLAGTGMDKRNDLLRQLITENGLVDEVSLLGRCSDVCDVMCAINLLVLSSSYGEAFPNVVAEAMACGTPCVVTDVGDSALIVAESGWVVPPRDPSALARGIEKAFSAIRSPEREMISQSCRQRILGSFALERMVSAYLNIWRDASQSSPGSPEAR